MKQLLLVTAVVSVIFALAGCKPSKEDEEVRNFVKNYVSVTQAAHATADMAVLAPYASLKELKKVFPVIQALQSTGNVMKTEILDFKVQGSKVKGETATVTTSERWTFWWQDRKTGSITKPKVTESYLLEYNLIKEKGQWKVDFIRNLKE